MSRLRNKLAVIAGGPSGIGAVVDGGVLRLSQSGQSFPARSNRPARRSPDGPKRACSHLERGFQCQSSKEKSLSSRAAAAE